eukprot:gene4806-5874_t
MIRREREARDEDKLLELQKQFTSGQDEEEPPQEAGVGDGATNETGPEAEEPPARTVGKVLERPTVAALPPSAPTVGKLSFPAPMHRSMAPWRQRKPPAPTPGTRDKKPRTSVIPPCDLRDAAAAPASSTAASRSSTSAALAGAGAASLDPGVAASKAMQVTFCPNPEPGSSQDKEQEAVRAEVDRRLANMSLGEIEDAQSELASRFSADKIAMLRKRGATKRYGAAAAGGLPAAAGTSQPEVSEEPPLAAAALQDTGLCKSALPPPMLPKGEAQRRRGASETRFDMDGQLVSAAGDEALQAVEVNMRDPVRFGGEHVAKGYTLIEMAELVRSSIPQQRMAALRMLSAALARIRQGVRDAPERWALIWVYALREAQLPLVLRHALDDRHDTVISAAATAMSALILPAQSLNDCVALMAGALTWIVEVVDAGKAAWEKATVDATVQEQWETAALDFAVRRQEGDQGDDGSDGNTDPVVTLLGAELLPRSLVRAQVAAIPGSVEPLVEVLVRCARQDQASATKMADCPRLLDMLYTEFVEELTAAEDSTLAGGSAAQRRSPEMRREYRSAAARALLVLRLVAELGGRRCADAVSRTGAVRAAASLVAAYASTGWETGASVPTEALRLWASAAARHYSEVMTRHGSDDSDAGNITDAKSVANDGRATETYRLLSALALPLPTASGGPSDRMAALGVRCAGAIMEMALTWLSTELVDHMTSLADGARQAAVCGALAAVLHFLTALCPRIGPPGCLQLLNAAAGATAEDEHCIAALQMAGDQLGKQVSRSLGSALVEDALDAEGGWGMVGGGGGGEGARFLWVRPLELDFPWVHFQRLRLRAVGAALQGAMRHWSGEEGAAGSKTDMLSMAEALDICQAVVATASPGDEHVAGSAVLWTMLLALTGAMRAQSGRATFSRAGERREHGQMQARVSWHDFECSLKLKVGRAALTGPGVEGIQDPSTGKRHEFVREGLDEQNGVDAGQPQMLQCIVKHADTAAMGACLPSDEEGATALGHALWENFALRLGLAASPGSGVVIGSRLPAPPGWALQALHGAGGNARLQGVRHPAWKRVAGGLALMAALRHCDPSEFIRTMRDTCGDEGSGTVFLDDDVDLAQHPSVRPLLVHLHLSLCHASASAAVTDGAATVAPSGVLAATGMLAVLRETGRSSWSELHEAYMDSLTTGSLDRSLSDGSIAAELAVRAVADFLFQ